MVFDKQIVLLHRISPFKYEISNIMNDDELKFPRVELSNVIDDDTEFIPLLTSEDEESMQAQKIPSTLSILPLRNTVLFP